MKVIDIEGDRISLTPEVLSVPEFYEIWKRDRSKFKKKAISELTYITFLVDNTLNNPYYGYDEVRRAEVLKKDFLDEDWKEDETILLAIEKYRELQKTTSSRLVAAAQIAAGQLAYYYTNIDFSLTGPDGKPVYNAKDVQSNLKDLANTIKSLYALDEQLRREQLDGNLTRGGFEINEFEIPSTDIDYGEDG